MNSGITYLWRFLSGFIISFVLMGIVFMLLVRCSGTADVERPRIGDARSLIDIYKSININDNDAVVAKKIVSRASDDMVYAGGDKDNPVWFVTAYKRPFTVEGIYWVLVLCFENEYIKGAHFGLSNNINKSPDNAPPPKGICASVDNPSIQS